MKKSDLPHPTQYPKVKWYKGQLKGELVAIVIYNNTHRFDLAVMPMQKCNDWHCEFRTATKARSIEWSNRFCRVGSEDDAKAQIVKRLKEFIKDNY